eukprot:TRINITY_DN848_c0_g1_i2.p1 TRINITY_DN848_c0_g1~~TRINITY_DN848_c0_g1_i2.p1  ORF type:complete len:125 (-),score=24.54 TRINITY_DN848_c0_g1_i2:160-534(-)
MDPIPVDGETQQPVQGSAGGQAFPSPYDETGESSFDKMERDLRGESLRLVCRLPSGTTKEVVCFIGQDVTFAKANLATQLDIEYRRIKLFLDGKLMFDPLSFNDFPAIADSTTKEIQIDVGIED